MYVDQETLMAEADPEQVPADEKVVDDAGDGRYSGGNTESDDDEGGFSGGNNPGKQWRKDSSGGADSSQGPKPSSG